MADPAITTLIAERLPTGLPHPGSADQKPRTIMLPAMRNTGIPAELTQHFADQAGLPTNDMPKLVAEALINLIETDGNSEIISRTELAELRQAAATLAGHTPTTITIHCHCDTNHTNPLLALAAGSGNQWTTNGRALINGLTRRNPECPHETTT